MWQWLQDNASTLQFFTSLAMVFVWVLYAQILVAGFTRQRKARILVNQGWGKQIDSVCLVSNMSYEPIYIQCIMMRLETPSGDYDSSVTDFDEVEPRDSKNRPEEVTRQGPLTTGNFMNIGTFRSLILQAAAQHDLIESMDTPIAEINLRSCQITIISSYGPEGGAIGSRRRFYIRGVDNHSMRPVTIDTQRLKHRHARHIMKQWLAQL